MTTETSFSWNFDTGTLSDTTAQSQQEHDRQRGSSFGVPLAACLPESHEPAATSKQPNQRAHAHIGGESDKLLRDRSDKVSLACDYYAIKATNDVIKLKISA